MQAILNDQVKGLSEFRNDVPDDLAEIVMRLLMKDSHRRYQTTVDLLNDLKNLYLKGETSISAPGLRKRTRLVVRIISLVLVAVIMAWALLKVASQFRSSSKPERIMLAVLPFDNLGESTLEYVVDGITEEIRVSLSHIPGLGVISRSSANKYENSDKDLSQIGQELGIDFVLQGTVQWDKSGEMTRLRISPTLIRISDNINLWADRYNAVLNDIFDVQVSVADNVAMALDVAIVDDEHGHVADRPTDNGDAYDFYLRGNHYNNRTENGMRQAESMYRRAIETDSAFALAWAKLGLVHVDMYWYYFDRSPDRLASAKSAIDRSLEMSPDLGEAHFALGMYFYRGHYDYHNAAKQFEIARRNQPNNSELIAALAWVRRRQGQWQESVSDFKSAIALDPRHAWIISELAGTLAYLRRYEEAEHYFDRALSLEPDLRSAHFQKSLMFYMRDGDTRAARQVLAEALEKNDRWSALTYLEMIFDKDDGDYQRAMSWLTGPGNAGVLPPIDTAEYCYLKGDIYRHTESTLSLVYFDSARVILESKGTEYSDDAWYHAYLGRVYAALGLKGRAISEAQSTLDLCPLSKDAILGADMIGAVAGIYIDAGELDLALDKLDTWLSVPSWASVPYLKMCPEFYPLRDHPRFQALIEKYEATH